MWVLIWCCYLHDFILLVILIYFIVPRLHDKDSDVLNRALFYSKKAYEEAHAAKESSIRIETTINNFIKEQLDKQTENSDTSQSRTKSSNKKQHFWYNVRYFVLTHFIQFILFFNNLHMTI